MNKNNYEKLNEINFKFFESAKISLKDPLGVSISNDVRWLKLGEKWNYSSFPVVIGGEGQPIILLHGFDSSFLEFRRIYTFLKKDSL